MAYASASGVAALTKNILGGEKQFSEESEPTLDEVQQWLSSGCSILESQLKGWGYATPAGSSTAAYDYIKNLNALFAATFVEMSRTNVTLAPGARTRGQVFEKMFWDGIDRLSKLDMTTLGLTRESTGKIYIGGIDVDDKQDYETDSDRVAPRFGRGMFEFSETDRPNATTAS